MELYLSLLNEEQADMSLRYVYSIFLPVAAKLLNLEQDEETIHFLRNKIDKKLSPGKSCTYHHSVTEPSAAL